MEDFFAHTIDEAKNTLTFVTQSPNESLVSELERWVSGRYQQFAKLPYL